METHVKVLAVLYIIFGVLGTLFGLGLMALLSFIGAAGAASDPDAWMALPILGFTGAALGAFMLALSVPGIVAGVGLLKPAVGAHSHHRPVGVEPHEFSGRHHRRRLRPVGDAVGRRRAPVCQRTDAASGLSASTDRPYCGDLGCGAADGPCGALLGRQNPPCSV